MFVILLVLLSPFGSCCLHSGYFSIVSFVGLDEIYSVLITCIHFQSMARSACPELTDSTDQLPPTLLLLNLRLKLILVRPHRRATLNPFQLTLHILRNMLVGPIMPQRAAPVLVKRRLSPRRVVVSRRRGKVAAVPDRPARRRPPDTARSDAAPFPVARE
jgi:hypothetical protein